MPFKEFDVKKFIEEESRNPEFKKHYDAISMEYEFIWKIVKARKEKGLTQKALADQIGVSQQEISRFERLRHVPRLSSLMKIIDAIGLELKLVNKDPEAEGYSSRLNEKESEYHRESDE
ncbi:MAG: helix-turn-helix transcriptional regulator [Clostridiales bacterium]|nr:helix-turn-helix transcriptional regulator [Clostridiales bacterium]